MEIQRVGAFLSQLMNCSIVLPHNTRTSLFIQKCCFVLLCCLLKTMLLLLFKK